MTRARLSMSPIDQGWPEAQALHESEGIMILHGNIKVNHRKIGEWWAIRRRGTTDVHRYRWSARFERGDWVRGELTHRETDGALVLASKVTAAAAIALAEATRDAGSPAGAESHNPTLETGVAQRGHGGPENGTPDLVAALRESIKRARARRLQQEAARRAEWRRMVAEYDALFKEYR